MKTFLMGLIGEGVTPSLTPPMHEAEGAAQGLGYVYRPVDLLELGLPGEAVGELLRSGAKLGFNAFNVTHPCKQTVLDFLDEVDPAAARLGACNTVLVRDRRLVGYNTDRSGFLSGIAEALPGADLTHVVQLGAGGAGSAVADAIVSLGERDAGEGPASASNGRNAKPRLSIVEPDVDRGRTLVGHLQRHHPGADVVYVEPSRVVETVARATGLVNASPVGMFTHPGLPLPVEALHPGLWVADIVYRPARTQLIETASALGCRVMEGGYMAVGQAADTFAMVTGLTPDRDRMRSHFRSMVQAEQRAAESGVEENNPAEGASNCPDS